MIGRWAGEVLVVVKQAIGSCRPGAVLRRRQLCGRLIERWRWSTICDTRVRP